MRSIREAFQKNPLAWLLAALLAFSIFSHRETGRRLRHVCELAEASIDGVNLERLRQNDNAWQLHRRCEEYLAPSDVVDDY